MPAPPDGRRRALRPGGLRTLLPMLGVLGALAAAFVLRGPAAVTPLATDLNASYTWSRTIADPLGLGGDTRRDHESGVFAATTSGRAGAVHGDTWSVYDPATRTELTRRKRDGRWAYTRTVGAWPPVWRTASSSPLDFQGVAAVVRSAVENGDPEVGVKPLKQGERPSWRAALTWPGGWKATLAVDQKSGIVTWYSSIGPAPDPGCGTVGDHIRSELEAMPGRGTWPAGTAPFTMRIPPGSEVTTLRERRYTYCPSLDAAARTVSFTVLSPSVVPDGYTLRAVATRYRQNVLLPTISANPDRLMTSRPRQNDNEIDLCYTRGLSWFTVTVTHIAGSKKTAEDVNTLKGALLPYELSCRTTVLQYGALKGRSATTWYTSRGPMLFAGDERYAVLAVGSLTRRELIALAEGLERLE